MKEQQWSPSAAWEYEMLTTRATKLIAGRYGGLENLGEKLMKGGELLKWRWTRSFG